MAAAQLRQGAVRFRLDLLYPQPQPDAEKAEAGEAFIAKLRAFLEEKSDPFQIEHDAKIPDDVVQGLKDLGAMGMKIPEEYGGLGLPVVYYNRAIALTGAWSGAIFHPAVSPTSPLALPSRCASSAPRSRNAVPPWWPAPTSAPSSSLQ